MITSRIRPNNAPLRRSLDRFTRRTRHDAELADRCDAARHHVRRRRARMTLTYLLILSFVGNHRVTHPRRAGAKARRRKRGGCVRKRCRVARTRIHAPSPPCSAALPRTASARSEIIANCKQFVPGEFWGRQRTFARKGRTTARATPSVATATGAASEFFLPPALHSETAPVVIASIVY